MDDGQLLTDSSGSLGGAFDLQSDDFNQVWDPAHIIGVILIAGEPVDLNGDGGVRFFLEMSQSMG